MTGLSPVWALWPHGGIDSVVTRQPGGLVEGEEAVLEQEECNSTNLAGLPVERLGDRSQTQQQIGMFESRRGRRNVDLDAACDDSTSDLDRLELDNGSGLDEQARARGVGQ